MLTSEPTKSNNSTSKLPDVFSLPGPKGKFLLGNLMEFEQSPLGFLTQCAQQYGGIVPFHLGSSPSILITEPEYIEQVFKNRELFGTPKILKVLFRTLLGQGLLTSDGDTWFRQRRLSQPVFHQKRIAGYGEVMVAYTEKMLASWQNGETKDIQAEMMHLTFNIVMKTLFSRDATDKEAQDVALAMGLAAPWFVENRKSPFPALSKRLPTPSNRRYQSAVRQLDKYIYRIIEERRSSGEDPGDLLSLMMQARDEDDGSQMSDKQLRDAIATLIFAGHETTANSLAWTWMLLAQYPEVQTKLQQELQTVLGDRTPTVADLAALQYTTMIVKESMRLYPVVWNRVSEASQDCELGGYKVPVGCTVIISQWVMHRSERYFENPEVFYPERWANDLEKELPKGVYAPFGGGPRTCIGKSFASMEAVLLLATIAQKFELNLIPNQSIIPEPTMTLQPKNGIKVVINQRVK
ncbi:cytochrome P450 [Scytonema sp. NUACC26]|uniref:cytochrome P450 n=1 Tax=Scytonema sp. NUACC26 TaxID=3140176 RepID=UPI0034DC5E87